MIQRNAPFAITRASPLSWPIGVLSPSPRTIHIAAATLDVFHTEPLPDDHPFWAHPKINITPHAASLTVQETAAVAIADNIRRIRAGEPPAPIVDPETGY